MNIEPNPVYFPTNRTDFLDDKNEKLIESFQNFMDFINEDPNLHVPLDNGEQDLLKDALAFLLEANKQLNPKDWEEKIDDLKNKIKELRDTNSDKTEVLKETTWLLNNAVTNLYQTSLAMKILEAENTKNSKKVNFLTQVLKNMESTRNIKKSMEKRKKAVSVGGINESFLPSWYKRKFDKA